MIELNKIYNEDCLEGMKRIPDKLIDCIICDLPYEVLNKKTNTLNGIRCYHLIGFGNNTTE